MRIIAQCKLAFFHILDSDSDFVELEKPDGSGDEKYEEIEEGGGEGVGMGVGGWVVSVCSVAVLLIAILVYL